MHTDHGSAGTAPRRRPHRREPRSARRLPISIALLACTHGALPAQRSVTVAPASTFEATPCPFPVLGTDSTAIACGIVRVPERWDVPGGRRIRIPVAVVRAVSPLPAPEALVLLGGGPLPTLRMAPRLLASPMRATRDLVLFDYRGMGAGDVVCPDVGAPYVRAMLADAPLAATLEARARLAAGCRAWADSARVDLGAYHARHMARDVLAIVAALRLGRWHVDALSFGTLVAQHVLRLAPPGLASVVLRGTVALDAERVPGNAVAESLEWMRRACGADPACATTYPAPLDDYRALYARLERSPLPVTLTPDPRVAPDGRAHVGGAALQFSVTFALYSRATLALVPYLLRETLAGNAAPITTLVTRTIGLGQELSGTNWAAQCDAMGAWAARGDATALADPTADYWRIELAHRCPALGVPPAPAPARRPIASDVPTLLLVGDHDPVTPPAYARAAAAALTRATIVTVPGRGHEYGGACLDGIVSRFRDAPGRGVDAGCVASMPAVPFAK